MNLQKELDKLLHKGFVQKAVKEDFDD